MTFEERINALQERMEFLFQSQESLGRNIEEMHERMNALQIVVSTHENEMERFRSALRAGLRDWLNGENGEEQ